MSDLDGPDQWRESNGLLIRFLCAYAWITILAKGSEASIEREIRLKFRKVTRHKAQNFGTELAQENRLVGGICHIDARLINITVPYEL